MATTPRHGLPFIYVTWLTRLLAGEAQCEFAAYFKSHFKYMKRPSLFDMAAWTIDHSTLVKFRAGELRSEGWTVTVEDQNAFKLLGKTGLLSGKPDIVAERSGEWLVVDCKTGQQQHSDYSQVLIYMAALQRVLEIAGRIAGEVSYRDRRIRIQPEELTADRAEEIWALVRRIGAGERPSPVPSANECAWCDISASDCPARIDEAERAVLVNDF